MSFAVSGSLFWSRLPIKTIFAAFSLVVLLIQIQGLSLTNFPTTAVSLPKDSLHPIHRRMINAKKEYNALLYRQSKTLDQARREYSRRHNTAPPNGFDQWYAYAKKHKSLIIDDFDLINENLRPFRSYLKGGCGLKLQDEKFMTEFRILQICIQDGKLSFSGETVEFLVEPFKRLVRDFVHELPDLCFQMNTADEPMSTLPIDTAPQEPGEQPFCPEISFVSYLKQNWWSQAVSNCPPQSPARMYPGRPDPERAAGRLLDDFHSATDICAYSMPVEHGVLISPSTLRMCTNVVPIFSNAGFSTSSDVLHPTLYRYAEWNQFKPKEDVPWKDKINKGYWRGSTTGGHSQSHAWDRFHRHRLVDYTNDPQNNLNNITDVKFSAVIQCDPAACDEMNDHYDIEGRPLQDVWKHKIVFDLDGNGLSGRFYPLMRSSSAVFRQTMFREWHDNRIFPWLHYVPLSMELTDLPELMTYYMGDGEKLLEEIGQEGQNVVESVLRKEDMKIYFYRLLLEVGRKN